MRDLHWHLCGIIEADFWGLMQFRRCACLRCEQSNCTGSVRVSPKIYPCRASCLVYVEWSCKSFVILMSIHCKSVKVRALKLLDGRNCWHDLKYFDSSGVPYCESKFVDCRLSTTLSKKNHCASQCLLRKIPGATICIYRDGAYIREFWDYERPSKRYWDVLSVSRFSVLYC
jgi:hypothetical protein